MLRHTREKQLAPQTGLKQALMGERDGMRIPGKGSAVFRCSFLCTGAYGQFMKRLLKMGNLRNLSNLNKKKNRQWRDQLLQWGQTEPAPTNAPSTGRRRVYEQT
jgi:hypothetical protein